MSTAMTETKPWYISSVPDSTDLSLTIKAALTALIPLILVVARMKGVSITENDVVGWITAITGAISAVGVVYGLFRKLWFWAYGNRS